MRIVWHGKSDIGLWFCLYSFWNHMPLGRPNLKKWIVTSVWREWWMKNRSDMYSYLGLFHVVTNHVRCPYNHYTWTLWQQNLEVIVNPRRMPKNSVTWVLLIFFPYCAFVLIVCLIHFLSEFFSLSFFNRYQMRLMSKPYKTN